MKKTILKVAIIAATLTSCKKDKISVVETNYPDMITSISVGLNPEGIEYNKNTQKFYLSSLNGGKIVAVDLNGNTAQFTSGEPYPITSVGLQIDYANNRLLVACANAQEIFDNDPTTKGVSILRVYNLNTGAFIKDVNLSSLVPLAPQYFANDLAVDNNGNVYVTDFGAWVIYKVDKSYNASVFLSDTNKLKQPNGIDFHPDGYLLASQLDFPIFAQYKLVKIPVNNPAATSSITVITPMFRGFDGFVLNSANNIVGITNNGTMQNTVIELKSSDGWQSASLVASKQINSSTTLAQIPGNIYYAINNDFQNPMATNWIIQRVKF